MKQTLNSSMRAIQLHEKKISWLALDISQEEPHQKRPVDLSYQYLWLPGEFFCFIFVLSDMLYFSLRQI